MKKFLILSILIASPIVLAMNFDLTPSPTFISSFIGSLIGASLGLFIGMIIGVGLIVGPW